MCLLAVMFLDRWGGEYIDAWGDEWCCSPFFHVLYISRSWVWAVAQLRSRCHLCCDELQKNILRRGAAVPGTVYLFDVCIIVIIVVTFLDRNEFDVVSCEVNRKKSL